MVRRGRDKAHTSGGVAGLSDPGVDLAAGQLAALAGLRTLGHLDLDFAGGDEILARHAEAGGRYLLDGGVALGTEAVLGLAALAGVGFTAQAVHSDGHAFVGFLRQCTVAHGGGLEALHDGIDALDLVQGHALFGVVEIQQTAQVHGVAVLISGSCGVLLERVVIAGPAGLLQQVDGLRVVEMLLGCGATAELVCTQAGQFAVDIQAQGVKGFLMAGFQILLDILDRDAAHAGDGVRKVFVHDLFRDAQRFKNLAARVGLDGGNAHLGRDFDNAREDGLVVILDGGIVIFVEQAVGNQPADGLLRQVRVDGCCAVAQERCEVMH